MIRRSIRMSVAARSLCLALSLVLTEGSPLAQPAGPDFVIRDIRVEGAQRTDVGTVFGYLPLRVGDRYDSSKGTAAVKALYASGLFKDVRLEADGDVLVVLVEERPAIASIDLIGMKEFDKDTVKKSLKEVGLAEARIYDRSVLERAEQELKRQYLSRGRYGVRVTTTVSPLERNRVNITISIDEGDVALIRDIRFTGNRAFSDSQLQDQMELSTPGWLTWYTGHDKYARQKLQADEETLRSYYLARGYLDFNIESTQVSISPDKKDIQITINVLEGERYRVSGVKLAGELLGLDAELNKLINVKPGEIYNGEKINAIAKSVTDRLSVLGYAFANANPVPDADKEKREVAFTILVDPGRRAYVRRVNISGNTHTRDEVIRREIRQFESGWFDSEKVKLSRDRIDRLGYFEKVEIETPAVPGSQDQVDMNVTVKERPTGAIQAGLGYSSTEHLVISGSYTQQNVLGTGHAIGLQANTSNATRTIALSHADPYVTLDGISRTEEIYNRNSNLAALGLATVDIGTTGGNIRWGVPFTEIDTIFFGTGVEDTSIRLTQSSPYRYIDYVNQFGSNAGALLGTIGWARDSRDNILTPNRGRLQRAFLEVGTPALDLQYYKLTYQFQQYQPLTNKFTLAFNGQTGYGGGYNGKEFPLFKNFYAGGIGSVRGFVAGTLGPRDFNGNPLGGTKEVNGSVEALATLPGADRSLRGLVFVDSGWVWGNGEAVKFHDLRASTGFGIAWISPIGPLKLSFAEPIRHESIDQIQRFQFQIGTGF